MECTQKSENRGTSTCRVSKILQTARQKGESHVGRNHMKAYATDIISSGLVKTSGSDRLYCHQKALPNGSWGLPGSSMRYRKTPGLLLDRQSAVNSFLVEGHLEEISSFNQTFRSIEGTSWPVLLQHQDVSLAFWMDFRSIENKRKQKVVGRPAIDSPRPRLYRISPRPSDCCQLGGTNRHKSAKADFGSNNSQNQSK